MPITFKSTLINDIKWYCNEILIENNEKYLVINDISSTTLLIKSVDLNDQKEYKLVIKDQLETYVYKTFLQVEGTFI